jgi:CubicO group peptidase (beta-lactamase class C family)
LWVADVALAQAASASQPALAPPAPVYPLTEWETVEDLAAAGWSEDALAEARTFSRSLGDLAVVLVEGGRVVTSWGDIRRTTIVQSVRKSLMNALIGVAVQAKLIRLDATLAELGIDDEPPLTPAERAATVEHLLQSRSGIYHDAASVPQEQRALRPPRGTHAPGEHFYYNNWDFNALGTIYEQTTGRGVYAAFAEDIAGPIGMQDFDPKDCEQRVEAGSRHAAHHFALSARDEGAWRGRQVVPAEWVAASTRAYSGDAREGYGYLWWIQPRINGFAARGGGAQLILVVPERDMVFVTQVVRTDEVQPNWRELGELLSLVLRAKTGS